MASALVDFAKNVPEFQTETPPARVNIEGRAVIVEDLVLSRADEQSRAELIESLKASAEAARSIAGRNQERRRQAALDRAQRLDRVIHFLENDSLASVPDEVDQALCEQVREKLKARGKW